VTQRDQPDQNIGEVLHGADYGSRIAVAVTRSMNSPLALM
jgi:hypothetical protein